MNTPPHIATAVQSFGEGNSDSDCYRGKTKSTPSTGVRQKTLVINHDLNIEKLFQLYWEI